MKWQVLVLALASIVAADVSTFNENDVKHFLSDLQVKYDDSASFEELSKLAQSEYEKLQTVGHNVVVDVNDDRNQEILKLATKPKADLQDVFPQTESKWGYLFRTDRSVKDWAFETWSASTLRNFLHKNGVSFGKKSTKQELLDLAKEKYDQIVKDNGVSGSYAGDWLYSGWSVDEAKKWLEDHEISFDPSQTKDDLISAVKENSYLASLEAIDAKNSLLDSLKLGRKEAFDKGEKIKDSFIDGWSYSQLREWLYIHGFIDTKPGVYADDLDIDKLKKLVKSHKAYLVSDIKQWSDRASKSADPYLSKASESAENAKDYINDTFLVGIDSWSKERLRDFLKARDVKFPQFASKQDLITYVKKSVNVPVKYKQSDSPFTGVLEGLSLGSVQKWLNQQGKNVNGARKDALSSLKEYYETKGSDIQTQIDLYKPDLDDYRESVTSSVRSFQSSLGDSADKAEKIAESEKSLAEDAILSSYNVAVQYYDEASKYLSKEVQNAGDSLESILQDAQDAAYEYSGLLSKEADYSKQKIEESASSVALAAKEFATSLSKSMKQKSKESKQAAHSYLDSAKSFVAGTIGKLTGQANDLQDAAEKYAEQASKSAEKAAKKAAKNANEAAQSAGEAAEEYKPDWNNAYSAASTKYGDYSSAVKDAAGTAYEQVEKSTKQAWDYIFQLYSKADLQSYLSSFGFDSDFLASLKRSDLVRLAQAQSDVFYGGGRTKWDKSIVELLQESSDDVRRALGLEPKHESVWDKVKNIW
ncbi:Meiotic sister chromatid recombination protein 1 [Meyerozyma sp. JA9]|nr:Meiotic sister chromatid recombination protein 1 [Meyerozyma sp. JA9]